MYTDFQNSHTWFLYFTLATTYISRHKISILLYLKKNFIQKQFVRFFSVEYACAEIRVCLCFNYLMH